MRGGLFLLLLLNSARAENLYRLRLDLPPPPRALPAIKPLAEVTLAPPPVPGQAEGLSARFSLGGIRWDREARLHLENLRLALSARSWTFNEGKFFSLQCQNVEAAWSLPVLLLSVEKPLGLQFESEGLRLSSKELTERLDELLRPLFSRAALERSLQFRGTCPGNADRVLLGLLRARLEDFPRKDAASYQKALEALAETLQNEMEKVLSFKKGLGGATGSENFILRRGTRAEGYPLFLENQNFDAGRLSHSARDQEESARAEGPAAQLLVTPEGLEKLLVRQLFPRFEKKAAAFHTGGERQTAFIDLKNTFKRDDFSDVLDELNQPGVPERLRLRLLFVDQKGKRAQPRVRFWLGRFNGGLDLEWPAALELWDELPAQGEPRARRSVGILRLRFALPLGEGKPGQPPLKFLGAQILEPASKAPGDLPSLPVEIALSLKVLLNGDTFAQFVEKQILASIPLLPKAAERLKLQLLFEMTEKTRRPDGAYNAEALLVTWPLPRGD